MAPPGASVPSHSTSVAAPPGWSGNQIVSQSDVSHHAPGVDTQATTQNRANPRVSPTGKQPQGVTRVAGPPHQKNPVATHTEEISNRFLWQADVLLFVRNHFLEFSRMFIKKGSSSRSNVCA